MYLNSSDGSYQNVLLVVIVTMFIETPVLIANSVDPDQTPQSVANVPFMGREA